MFFKDESLTTRVLACISAFLILFSIILGCFFCELYEDTHCTEVVIVYVDGTTETFHCKMLYERFDCLLVDDERRIMYENIREYSFTDLICACSSER